MPSGIVGHLAYHPPATTCHPLPLHDSRQRRAFSTCPPAWRRAKLASSACSPLLSCLAPALSLMAPVCGPLLASIGVWTSASSKLFPAQASLVRLAWPATTVEHASQVAKRQPAVPCLMLQVAPAACLPKLSGHQSGFRAGCLVLTASGACPDMGAWQACSIWIRYVMHRLVMLCLAILPLVCIAWRASLAVCRLTWRPLRGAMGKVIATALSNPLSTGCAGTRWPLTGCSGLHQAPQRRRTRLTPCLAQRGGLPSGQTRRASDQCCRRDRQGFPQRKQAGGGGGTVALAVSW